MITFITFIATFINSKIRELTTKTMLIITLVDSCIAFALITYGLAGKFSRPVCFIASVYAFFYFVSATAEIGIVITCAKHMSINNLYETIENADK